jgi:hypothetical protein
MSQATEPHAYVPERGGWRTCAICGQGANASIHRKRKEG